MPEGWELMSHKELDRLQVLEALARRAMSQAEAAGHLGLSMRQVKRLVRRYRQHGVEGLVLRRRGRPANNTITTARRDAMMTIVGLHFADFGPTLAAEKLREMHHLVVSKETLRRWMIDAGLWRYTTRKQPRTHPSRPRRPRFGELIQVDGSPHDWFEGRAPACTLIVFIDDATSHLTDLALVPAETTQACMEALQRHLARYGRPLAVYSDKHSIFRTNHPDHGGELTQFTRVLKTLDTEPIHAHSPQAKGRVERANQTLQDRLVKELRLHSISDLAAANGFLPAFIKRYNERFGRAALNPDDAHRPVLHDCADLQLIFTRHYQRRLSKNLGIRFQNTEYQLTEIGQGHRLRGARVTVCEAFDGTVTLLKAGRVLLHRVLSAGEPPTPIETGKSVQRVVERAILKQAGQAPFKPAPDHPWRRAAVPSRA